MTDVRFNSAALFTALDDKRQARGLTWAALAREITRVPKQQPIAVSTIKNLGRNRVSEGDGVIQMLLWLGQPPEAFVEGVACDETTTLPEVPAGKTIRWDTRAVHRSLAEVRQARALSWSQVADQIGVNTPSLTRLAKGGRIGMGTLVRIAAWLNQPAVAFTRITKR